MIDEKLKAMIKEKGLFTILNDDYNKDDDEKVFGWRDIDRFKEAAFINEQITEHPKREKMFLLAWEQGHSSGYSDVLSYLGDIVEYLFGDELDKK